MPAGNHKPKQSPKRMRKHNNHQKQDSIMQDSNKAKKHKQTAGAESNICSKDINQLLMGNPPVSIGAVNPSEVWRDTKKTGKELDSYSKKGWGNYPGTPPQPDCIIL